MIMDLLHRLYLCIVSLLILMPLNESCSCVGGYPRQKTLCSSKLVMRIVVLEKYEKPLVPVEGEGGIISISIGTQVHYIVKIERVYKDDTIWGYDTSYAVVQTCNNGACCGVGLAKGSKYVVNGLVDDNTGFIKISSCGFNQDWDKMDKKEQKNLVKQIKNCKCQFNICYDRYSEDCDLSLPCTYIGSEYRRAHCYDTRSYCGRTNTGGCEWKQTKQLVQCLSQHPIPSPPPIAVGK